jgi:hypothetical protein
MSNTDTMILRPTSWRIAGKGCSHVAASVRVLLALGLALLASSADAQRLSWEQDAPQHTDALVRYLYEASVDGGPFEQLAGVECDGVSAPFACSASISAGARAVRMRAVDIIDTVRYESAESQATTGRTLYVNGATGNDATTYAQNSEATPWRTVGRAAWGSTNREARVASEAAQAGDVVLVAAGTYAAGQGTNSRSTPLLYSHNQGTAAAPITYRAVGEVRLTQTGAGPIIGSYDRDYIVWDGFTIDETQARSVADTGPVVAWFCTGCQFLNLTIIGNGDDNRADNHAGIRLEQSDAIVIRGNRISNFYCTANRNNGAGIMTYSSFGLTIENNEIHHTGAGIFLKGGPYRGSGAVIRYNRIHHTGTGSYANDTADGAAIALHAGAAGTASAPVLVAQNLLHDGAYAGVRIWGFDGTNPQNNPMHTKIVNNTIVNMPKGVYLDALPVANASHLVANNVIVGAEEVLSYNTQAGSPGDATRVSFLRNVGQGATWSIVPNNNRRTLAQWQAATGQDAGSVQADPQLVDYRPGSGSPAIGVGRAVYGVGGADGWIIPAGAYITGTETIGPGGSAPPPPPPTPVDCVGTWGAWTRQAGSESTCVDGSRTYIESRLFTVVTPASNGGAACPASPESRTQPELCTVVPTTMVCTVRGTPAPYADGDIRRTIRCDTNGPVNLPIGATFTIPRPQ